MRSIELTNGYVCVVSDQDYDVVSRMNWRAVKTRALSPRIYAASQIYFPGTQKQQGVLMHRLILGLEKGDRREVDHIDGNGLNNQRDNLRMASREQNLWNNRTIRATSGFKGVFYYRGKWNAQICSHGKMKYIGRFQSKEEAAAAWDDACISLRGDFGITNAQLK